MKKGWWVVPGCNRSMSRHALTNSSGLFALPAARGCRVARHRGTLRGAPSAGVVSCRCSVKCRAEGGGDGIGLASLADRKRERERTILCSHDMSVVNGIKKTLFLCHLPSALFLTQKNSAHVICFRYQKYHTYFFAIGLCYARQPKHMSS